MRVCIIFLVCLEMCWTHPGSTIREELGHGFQLQVHWPSFTSLQFANPSLQFPTTLFFPAPLFASLKKKMFWNKKDAKQIKRKI